MSDLHTRTRQEIAAELQKDLDHHEAAIKQAAAQKNHPSLRAFTASADRLRSRIADLQAMEGPAMGDMS